MTKGRPEAALRHLTRSETGLGLMVGRDGPTSLTRRCPGWIPLGCRATPTGPTQRRLLRFVRGRPDLAALHLRRPVKHGIQVRTTSFLRFLY